MSKDLYDFINNDFYKHMIKYEGMMGSFFSIRSFVASFFSIFLIFIITDILKEKPNLLENDFKFKDIVLLFFVFFSTLYLLYKSFYPLYFYFKSKSWSEVTANINDIYISKMKLGYHLTYNPIIRYEFKVNGKKYKGGKLSFENKKFQNGLDPHTSSKYDKLNFDFGNWVETKKVKVYYNPNNPNQSVIYRDISTFGFIVYLFIFILFSSIYVTILFRIIYILLIKN